MRNRLLLLFSFLLLSSPILLVSQSRMNRVLHDFHNQNGLSADEVFGIAQDANGVLWIGSTKGIHRFDGQKSRLYGSAQGIISQVITRIFLLNDSSLLAIGEKPTALYTIKNDQLKIRNPDFEHRLNGNILCLSNDKKGVYAFSTNKKQIIYIDKDTVHVTLDSIRRIRSLFHTPSGILIASQVESNTSHPPNPEADPQTLEVLQQNFITKYITSSNNKVYGVNSKYLIEIKPNHRADTLARFRAEDQIIDPNFFLQDKDGGFWFSGYFSGLHYFNPLSKKTLKLDEDFGLRGVPISHMFKDAEDNIWLSTIGRGIKCLRPSIFKNYTISNGLPNNYISALHSGKEGDLWIGTYSGLGILKNDKPNSSNQAIEAFPDLGAIRSFSEDWSGNLLISNEYGNSDNEVKYPKDATFLPQLTRSLTQVDTNLILHATWITLYYYKKVQDIKSHSKNSIDLIRMKEPIRKVLVWKKKELVLTEKGLYQKTDSGFHKMDIPILKEQQQNNALEFYDMIKGKDNEIWIGSSKGLIHKKEEAWEFYNKNHGLHAEICEKLEYEPHTDRLWIATRRGLSSYWNGEFHSYTKSDGLLSNEINTILNDTINNCIWVGTSNGLSQLDKSNISRVSSTIKKVSIYRTEIMGDSVVYYPKQLYLKPYENHLNIYFSSPYLFNAEEAEYEFKLEGLHSHWQSANTSNPHAEFLALSPGNYTFVARSRKLGSEWSETSVLEFNIATPFWKKNSFRLSVILLFIFGTIAIAQLRIKNVKIKERAKRQTLNTLNQLELQAFHYSMNPHFLFNSLNSIQQFITKYKDAVAINFISEFSLLVRNNLEALRSGWITLESEIEQLERYLSLESHRLNHSLSYKIEIDPSISIQNIEVPPLFIQPFIENSIWHGIAPKRNKEGSFIHVNFQHLDTDVLSITIEDNGVGLHAGQSNKKPGHVSRGIELIRKRLQLLSENNELEILETKDDDGNPSGTLVSIIFHAVN